MGKYNRLLKAIDELIAEGKITDTVFAQIGFSDYKPKHFETCDYMKKEMMDQKIKESDLIITHSGVGTIMTAIQLGKRVLVYPRLVKYKEHVDDHQVEIGLAFEKRNYVCLCKESDDLLQKIQEAMTKKLNRYESSKGRIPNLIEQFINENFAEKIKGEKECQ